MRVRHFAVLVAGLAALPNQLTLAQASDTLSPAQRVGLALARLGSGERMRIHATGIGRVEGDLVSRTANLVTLSRGYQRFTEIPASSVDSLWVKGNHAGIGGLVGFTVGGLGLLAGYAASNPSAGPSGLVVGLAGGGAGAVIGALIGAAFPKWRLQVP